MKQPERLASKLDITNTQYISLKYSSTYLKKGILVNNNVQTQFKIYYVSVA